MLCENCGERRAEVHFVRVLNGEKREEHICRQCAEQLLPFNEAAKMMKMSFSLEGIMNVEEALKSLLLPMIPEIYGLDDKEIKCPHCGGSLDTEALMDLFAEGLHRDESLEELHDVLPEAVAYEEDVERRRQQYRERLFEKDAGVEAKLPVKEETLPEDPVERELAGLKKELAFVLRGERYERAAEIRDRIFELEKNLTDK